MHDPTRESAMRPALPRRFEPSSMWAVVLAALAFMALVAAFGVLAGRDKQQAVAAVPPVETTGSAAVPQQQQALKMPEIDPATGAPLTRLGPNELTTARDGLLHPVPMRPH